MNSKKIIKNIIFGLAGITALIVGGLAYVWFFGLKPYAENLEKPRVPLLKKIAAAQTKFRDQDLDKDGVKDFANVKELIKANLLTYEEVQKAGFVFVEPATTSPKNYWWAVAQPLHPSQGRSFFINQTGVIYYSSETPWDLESRINRKTAEVPSAMQELNTP